MQLSVPILYLEETVVDPIGECMIYLAIEENLYRAMYQSCAENKLSERGGERERSA